MAAQKLIGLILAMATVILLSACTAPPAEQKSATSSSQSLTGRSDLDVIIAAALKRDVDQLRSLISFTKTKCTNAVGLGGPPKCLQNEPEGTTVEVLPFLGPEGHFTRKEDISNWKGLDVSKLYAVYQVSDKAYTDPDYPVGEYAIVFLGSQEHRTSVTLQVRQGRIVRIDDEFEYPPRIRQEDVGKYLVPPINVR